MYCPVCFQDTLKIRSHGVIKLAFNHKSRNTSLFTYNINKESIEEIKLKLKEKIVDYISWYSEFKNKATIKEFEIYSGDFQCIRNCKIDMIQTKVSVIGSLFDKDEVYEMLESECKKFKVEIKLVKT
jgi:hypothetical protein